MRLHKAIWPPPVHYALCSAIERCLYVDSYDAGELPDGRLGRHSRAAGICSPFVRRDFNSLP